MKITKTEQWRAYWGAMPLPERAKALGIIERDAGDVGALIEMPTGLLVQGNAGCLRSLPQRDVHLHLAAVENGAAGGQASGESKRRGGPEYYRALVARRKDRAC